MLRLERLIALRLVSHDAEALARFYVSALGFERQAAAPIAAQEIAQLGLTGGGQRVPLALGKQCLEIDQFAEPGRPYPLPSASNDRLFQHFAIVTHDMPNAWTRMLAAAGQPISPQGPVKLPPENGSVTAAKFRDPEGHPLEFLAFPAADHPVGIDHSAIVVDDVEASIAFYTERGLTIGKRTLNHGPAQAGLDDLVHPQVDVVPLQPPEPGPHLELLGYRQPATGDGQGWTVRDVAATRLVWQANRRALLRDPDGHLHQCQPSGTPPASPPGSA